MKNYIVECIGTFFLVLVVGLSVIEPNAGPMAPLAIGSILMVMIYAGGPISGGHYNPAVTLAVWMRGKCTARDVPFYMSAQMIGGAFAALVVKALKIDSLISAMNLNVGRALLAEFIFTFALAFVVLNVATSRKVEGNSYFGLAIGFTVMAGAYAAGNISGGVFNPAVAIGITIMGLAPLSHLWMYLVGNFAGGALAAVIFKVVHAEE